MADSELTSTEAEYSQFLASIWDEGFSHSYQMPDPKGSAVHWHNWRGGYSSVWQCNSLKDASGQFCWDYVAQRQGNGTSEECRSQLQRAIVEKDDDGAEAASLAIFKWGGVARSGDDRSRVWIRDLKTQGQLISRISEALKLLRTPVDTSNYFDGTAYLMNSATTKMYAFADPTDCMPIYDGRVGAAMALIVVRYCFAKRMPNVPAELRFAWLDGRTRRDGRNPNTGTLTFPRLNGNDQKHAQNMWRACRMLNAAAQAASCSVLQLERALFMIGYDVRGRTLR